MKTSSNVIGARRRPQVGLRHVEAVRCAEPCGNRMTKYRVTNGARASLPSARRLDHLAALFALLANPTRLKLLLALQPRPGQPPHELCVCDLAAIASASESMTSHQFRLLRAAGLVSFRRRGKLALYRLTEGPARHLLTTALQQMQL